MCPNESSTAVATENLMFLGNEKNDFLGQGHHFVYGEIHKKIIAKPRRNL